MKNYQTIMTTLDLSELDNLLVDYTLKMADCLGGKTIFGAHIIPVFLLPGIIKLDPQNYFMPSAPAVEKIREQVFAEIKSRSGQRKLSIHVKIEEGRIFGKLMEIAEEVEPDLLIFGKKEKSKGSGITATRMAHRVRTDLLLVPQNATVDFKKIMVPIDFSTNSFRAVATAMRLQEATGQQTKIDLIYIQDATFMKKYGSYRLDENLNEVLVETAQQKYQDFLKRYRLDTANFNYTSKITEGENIAYNLLDFSQTNQYDLVIMGAKGHTGLSNFVFGSVAETLMDLTNQIPLMIVR